MKTLIIILGIMVVLSIFGIKMELKKIRKWKIEFGEKFTESIVKHRLEVGMNEEMVNLSWGKPSSTKNREKVNEVKSTWTWNKRDKQHKRFAIFINGELTEFGGK